MSDYENDPAKSGTPSEEGTSPKSGTEKETESTTNSELGDRAADTGFGQTSSLPSHEHGGSDRPHRPWKGLDVWKGIGFVALGHLLWLFAIPMYFGIGIVQMLYVLPLLLIFSKRAAVVQGILIGAGITFLLNAACFGYVMFSLG
ncbi:MULTISPECIES: hypothetical protein [unclassified Paenibacillus]|uniref:hypothetical protein n=1 Tax=unclassified Paenibacillus TaxID=185978 RepID=UPI00020D6F63|nr:MULTISPECIES: hypothetical protein [unclassified Paenibacillus]EGL15799.1 hypothetical protein HMPREF9413_5094 [Paenibacillus sp. HGF7]EPD88181.1 hypothetical protein HMPREF1207_02355 [Paenibacillus sp. HGH0039]